MSYKSTDHLVLGWFWKFLSEPSYFSTGSTGKRIEWKRRGCSLLCSWIMGLLRNGRCRQSFSRLT